MNVPNASTFGIQQLGITLKAAPSSSKIRKHNTETVLGECNTLLKSLTPSHVDQTDLTQAFLTLGQTLFKMMSDKTNLPATLTEQLTSLLSNLEGFRQESPSDYTDIFETPWQRNASASLTVNGQSLDVHFNVGPAPAQGKWEGYLKECVLFVSSRPPASAPTVQAEEECHSSTLDIPVPPELILSVQRSADDKIMILKLRQMVLTEPVLDRPVESATRARADEEKAAKTLEELKAENEAELLADTGVADLLAGLENLE